MPDMTCTANNVTVAQVRRELGLKRSTAYELFELGLIRHVRTGARGKLIRTSWACVAEYLAGQEQKQATAERN